MSNDTTSADRGSYWNYRTLRQEHRTDDEKPYVEYEIVEAYYEDNRPVAYCDPHVVGDSVDELRRILAMMHEAFEKPVLALSDFKGPREVAQAGGVEPDASPADSGDER